MMDTVEPPPVLDRGLLAPVVRRALGRASVQVERYRLHRVTYAAINPVSGGVYRVEGVARNGAEALSWSLVLKAVCRPRGDGPDESASARPAYADPARPDDWRREVLAYQSGLLDHSGDGMRAARCLGITERSNDVAWVWLEDLSGSHRERWEPSHYRRVAEDLGRFSARHAEGPPPSHPWLLQRCVRAIANARGAAALDLIERPDTWQHPLVRRSFPEPVADRLLRLWHERDIYLDALDRLPRTLCHFDISRPNVFLLDRAGDERETVAIDWASVGIGAAGEDLSLLVPSPFFRLEDDATRLPDQAEMVYEAYLRGLIDAGWQGDERQVRLAYTIAVALRTVFIAPTLPAILDQRAGADEEERWGLRSRRSWRGALR